MPEPAALPFKLTQRIKSDHFPCGHLVLRKLNCLSESQRIPAWFEIASVHDCVSTAIAIVRSNKSEPVLIVPIDHRSSLHVRSQIDP